MYQEECKLLLINCGAVIRCRRQTDEELDNLIGVRSRAISRKLRAVQTMDESAAAALLELDAEPGRPVTAKLPENGEE